MTPKGSKKRGLLAQLLPNSPPRTFRQWPQSNVRSAGYVKVIAPASLSLMTAGHRHEQRFTGAGPCVARNGAVTETYDYCDANDDRLDETMGFVGQATCLASQSPVVFALCAKVTRTLTCGTGKAAFLAAARSKLSTKIAMRLTRKPAS